MKKVFHSYRIVFNDIFKQNEDPKTIQTMTVVVWASGLQEAIDAAWKAVTVSPEEYEIVTVVQDDQRYTYASAP